MSSSSYRSDTPTYFLHIHVQGLQTCMWYCESVEKFVPRTGARFEHTKFGVHTDILFAHACDAEAGHVNVQKLIGAGVPVTEATLIPCDSVEILTPEMRRVLNLA